VKWYSGPLLQNYPFFRVIIREIIDNFADC